MLAHVALLQHRTVVIEWWPRGLVAWLFLGLVAGWLAGQLSRGRGFGCITDIILGLIGSFIGGWVFTKLGIFGGGFLFSLAAATLGAVILIALSWSRGSFVPISAFNGPQWLAILYLGVLGFSFSGFSFRFRIFAFFIIRSGVAARRKRS